MLKQFALITLFLLCCYSFQASSQTETYSRVKVYTEDDGLLKMAAAGLSVESGDFKRGVYFISDFSSREIKIISQLGLKYELLIADVQLYYVEQNNGSRDDDSPSADPTGHCELGLDYPTPTHFKLGSMGGYLTYAEMLKNLDSMAILYPSLITVKDTIGTGTTIDGRPLYWVKISDNPNIDEPEPEILYTAVHHAREPGSMFQMIFYMWYLLENYATNTEAQYLVDNIEMYFVPCVNPDGYIYNETTNPNGGGLWRKNRRNNMDGTFGVDLNRNYGYQWGFDNTGSSPNTNSEVYRGTSAFSEPETSLIRDFCNSREFRFCFNYHAYGNLLIYPWGYIAGLQTPDSSIFYHYVQLLTRQNDYTGGTGDQTVGYIVNGDADDWMYGEQTTKDKIFAFTPEVGSVTYGFWPPSGQIENICKANLWQNLYAAHLVGDFGIVEDETDKLIDKDSAFFYYTFRNLGIDTGSTFTVTFTGLDTNLLQFGAVKTYSSLQLNDAIIDSIIYTLDTSLIAKGDSFYYSIAVDNGLFTITDTLTKYFGEVITVYTETGDNISKWNTSVWDVTTAEYYSPSSSITDSKSGNYSSWSNETCTLNTIIDLRNTDRAYLTFWAKWDIEARFDYAQIEARKLASNWIPLCGNYTKLGNFNQDPNEPIYDGFQDVWVKEEMDLKSFLGNEIEIRFKLVSDGGTNFDGFYFDDFTVVRIGDTVTVSNPNIPNYSNDIYISQNIPNPFSSFTSINYSIPNDLLNPMLIVYNIVGEKVIERMLDNEHEGQIVLDLTHWQSGIYFYNIAAGDISSGIKKMVVIK
ncbi:MAG: immune inhibitor A [Bacteroidetes bacterium]|nr:immune inhibitor A [Bacteroidota bacterium]